MQTIKRVFRPDTRDLWAPFSALITHPLRPAWGQARRRDWQPPPARVQALSLHLYRDPKSTNLKGKRLESGDLEGSGQTQVSGIHTLILPKQAFLGAETEPALCVLSSEVGSQNWKFAAQVAPGYLHSGWKLGQRGRPGLLRLTSNHSSTLGRCLRLKFSQVESGGRFWARLCTKLLLLYGPVRTVGAHAGRLLETGGGYEEGTEIKKGVTSLCLWPS